MVLKNRDMRISASGIKCKNHQKLTLFKIETLLYFPHFSPLKKLRVASFWIWWTLRSSVLVVFNNFLLIDATDRSKISSDQKRFFIALSLYPLSFFANTPFNCNCKCKNKPPGPSPHLSSDIECPGCLLMMLLKRL